jgi:peptidoglycan/xylan/chitin deacetylase (PgdA/CDA1 family)
MSIFAIALALLVPATAACLYYVLLTLVGLRARYRALPPEPKHTFVVLIPAHNEEGSLPATLRAVLALDYPTDMVRVCVVADNCTDRTAQVARETGVIVLVRDDPSRIGKGHALSFGFRAVAADGPDAVLILDADCTISPGALRQLDATFASGAEAAQLAVRSVNADDGPAGYAAAVGSEVDDRVAAGLCRLGCSVPLRGTGMAFRAAVLERVPWDAYTAVEDSEYAGRLRAAGVRVRLVPGPGVRCRAPRRLATLCRQRRRWRGALRPSGTIELPLRAARSKPLVLAHLVVTAAVAAAIGGSVLPAWAATLLILTAGVYLRAVWAVGLSWRRAGLLLLTPVIVARLAAIASAGLFRRPAGWGRASRGRPRLVRRPRRAVRWLTAAFSRSDEPGAPHVSLTFDDGPHPVQTPLVLDRLARFGTTATFFMIGERAAAARELVERVRRGGHAVGNHTFTHPRFGLFDFAAPLLELEQCQEVVSGTAFRPPFGRLTPGVWLAARRVGLTVRLWSVDSGDWRCRNEAEAVECARQLLEIAEPGDVILLHDDRLWIGLILDILLPGLAARGLLETTPLNTVPHRNVPAPGLVLAGRAKAASDLSNA